MRVVIHTINKIASGYEYFFSVLDDADNVVRGNQIEFAGTKLPTEAQINDWKMSVIDRVQRQIEEEGKPKPVKVEATDVDARLIDIKAKVKKIAILTIKTKSNCTVDDIKTEVNIQIGSLASLMTDGFLNLYIQEAFQRGYINEPTFDALKLLIKEHTVEELENLR